MYISFLRMDERSLTDFLSMREISVNAYVLLLRDVLICDNQKLCQFFSKKKNGDPVCKMS